MNVEINIKVKLSQDPTVVRNANPLQPTERNLDVGQSICGSANNDSGNNPNVIRNNNENGITLSCANQMSSGSQSDMTVNMPTPQVCNANYFVAPSDLTLPYFNDSTKVNVIYHL
jgi:hypothetical protein